MRARLLLIFFYLFTSLELKGQDSDSNGSQLITSVIPMGPNAASLAKYIDVPVSYYTGTPNISIPLYEVNQGSITVPVSLNYHSSGIRVDDIAPWVGLGWSLSSGGAISRTVKGLADESTNGFFNQGYLTDSPSSITDPNYLYNISIGNVIDSEPDIYFLNLPNGGGVKFTFDYSGNIVLQNYQQIQITKDAQLQQWKVITQDGTQYFFGANGDYGANETTTYSPESGASMTSTSSWQLSKIISPDNVDVVYFKYGNAENFDLNSDVQQTYYQRDYNYISINPLYIWCDEIPASQPVVTGSTSVAQNLISEIIYNQGSIEFTTGGSRVDLAPAQSLGKVSVKDNQGNIIKYYNLGYSSFGSSNSYRLKLVSVTEFNSLGQSLPPYKFQYDETNPLPERGSYKQDHWGYFNTNTANTFIPQKIDKGDGTFIYYSQGGNRDTDIALTTSSLLTQITYPEGGYDVLEYEANDIGKVANGYATEYYTESVEVTSNATAQTDTGNGVTATNSFRLDQPYSVELSIGGGCFPATPPGGTPHEKAQANSSISGPNNFFMGWSCLETPQVYNVILQAGTYNLSAFSEWVAENYYSDSYLYVKIYKTRQVPVTVPQYVGGARIKRITRYDGNTLVPEVTRFKYETLSGTPSGVLVRKPSYYFKYLGSKDLTELYGVVLACPYDAGFSASKVQLGDGTHVGYSSVKIFHGENGENGYELYNYTTASDWPDAGGDKFPFPSPDSRDSRRGLLKEKIVFDNNNNYRSHIINMYKQRTDQYYTFSKGLKVGMMFPRKLDQFPEDYTQSATYFWQEWQYLESTTERIYSARNDNSYEESVTNYFYDRPTNHIQLTRVEKNLSDGSTLKTLYKYPQDYVVGSGDVVNMNSLISAHVYNAVSEEQNWKVANGIAKLLTGKITDYNAQFYKPSKVWLLENSLPVASLSSENLSSGKYTNLISDPSLYTTRAQFVYQNGRVISQYKSSDMQYSYVWGYKNTFATAQATNTDPTSIAFTGFEDDSDGNWVVPSLVRITTSSFTGLNSYSLSNGSITKAGLVSSKTYKVCLRATSGASIQINGIAPVAGQTTNAWTYYELKLTGVTNIAISGSGIVDDLRLYPDGSQMTTYTYNSAGGMTSMTDANNQTVYYEYDPFKRLTIIRDFKGSIVKRYTYNYQVR